MRPSRAPSLRAGLSVAIVACLLAALPAPRAGAADLSKEEKRWAKDCLKRLAVEDAAMRRGVGRAIAALGTDAVPLLADAWWNAKDDAEAARVQVLLRGIGRDAVLKRLERMKEGARGAEEKMLNALVSVLSEEASPEEEAAVPAPREEREEQRWAKECLARFRANSPRVREGAEHALAALGLDAMPVLLDMWVKTRSRTEEAAVQRVLLEIGRDGVVKRLWQLRDGAHGSEAERLDALLSELGAASPPGTTNVYPLQASIALDWTLVPPAAEHVVREWMPQALGLGRYPVRREGRQLVVDVNGDGTPEARFESASPATVVFHVRGGDRPVLLYDKLGEWYACSASLLVGDAGAAGKEVPIQVLDGDLDGTIGGEADFLRIGDAAFAPYRKGGLVLLDEDPARYEIVREKDASELRLEVLERLARLDKDAWEGLVALNRFRARCGLAPLGLDEKRSDACRRHAQYLAANMRRREGEDPGGTTHEENPSLTGYSKEGEEAAAAANIGIGGDLVATIERNTGAMLHRAAWLCEASVGAGLGATRRAGGWSVIWTGAGAADGEAPVLVPAPGARGVPRTGAAEWPTPQRAPGAYEGRFGYPVSVTFDPLPYTDVRLVLFLADGTTQVPGHCFTPEQPISKEFPRNGGSAYFLPSEPLARGTQHWALFTARRDGKDVRFAWTFYAD